MKTIGTSIYIDKSRHQRIRETVTLLKTSEPELLSALLQRSRALFSNKAICYKTVRYQKNCTSESYKISHITLFATDYELATSRRYVFKISVSFLFNLAVDLYLQSIIDELTTDKQDSKTQTRKHQTNYYYNNFNIDRFCNSLAEFWVIPWPRE